MILKTSDRLMIINTFDLVLAESNKRTNKVLTTNGKSLK